MLDVRGIDTALRGRVHLAPEQSAAALETLSRFGADPRALLYLPPTIAPCETSQNSGYLEYPSEAFEFYRRAGVEQVICQEKHMESRALLLKQLGTAHFGWPPQSYGPGVLAHRAPLF